MSENTQAFEREISIQVRSPSLDETLNVQAKLSATVLSLKEAIFSIHPTHPIAENQRIIYSGKLLQDNEILSTVLKNVTLICVALFFSCTHALFLFSLMSK